MNGLSPLALCGVVFAGANRPPDVLGRLEGVISAEEIAGLDLSRCELAVLACRQPSTGERRAGQGVAALRLALHAAGVRNVIASLWGVDDQAARALMVDLQRRTWVEKKPIARALWEAKSSLRELRDAEGRALYSVRDWAGWVLSSEP